ncbi:MAG: hypothetical protein KatS3mg077_0063 [Candidatus Binatia bacterium]|nr:MAG: hypothetical protein KatS3mg077_0063 [Candidatus Binatia bacterium]
MKKVRGRTILLLASLAWTVASPGPLAAKQHGITGYSGVRGETCGDSCHGEGAVPELEVRGPSTVARGALVSWQIRVRMTNGRGVAAGVNIAASAGGLIPGVGLYAEESELTHANPARSADGNSDQVVSAADFARVVPAIEPGRNAQACSAGDVNGDGWADGADLLSLAKRLFDGGVPVEWDFQWLAPPSPQVVEFYAAGVAANCNGTRGGDGAAVTVWTVQVQ